MENEARFRYNGLSYNIECQFLTMRFHSTGYAIDFRDYKYKIYKFDTPR